MRNTITGVLILCACMTVEASFPAAACMILAALVMQRRRARHGG